MEWGWIAEILERISGRNPMGGIDSPSGGQARPLGEFIGTGRADAND
jgi:hypothetical protein